MNEANLETSIPQFIEFLLYFIVLILIVIVVLLGVITFKLQTLSIFLQRSRAKRLENKPFSIPQMQAEAGTQFEVFLSEDPARHKLTKKEQFKAYRMWREEKGLNWKK